MVQLPFNTASVLTCEVKWAQRHWEQWKVLLNSSNCKINICPSVKIDRLCQTCNTETHLSLIHRSLWGLWRISLQTWWFYSSFIDGTKDSVKKTVSIAALNVKSTGSKQKVWSLKCATGKTTEAGLLLLIDCLISRDKRLKEQQSKLIN